MTLPDKIEDIDDVHAVLAEIRTRLEEVQEMDLSDPAAVILLEPLQALYEQLTRLKQDIEEVIGHGG